MNYSEAVRLKENNLSLLGKTYKGGKIDEIIIAPTNPESCERFLKSYLINLDGEKSIPPFTNEDVEVFVVISKDYFRKTNIFSHISIHSISDEHQLK